MPIRRELISSLLQNGFDIDAYKTEADAIIREIETHKRLTWSPFGDLDPEMWAAKQHRQMRDHCDDPNMLQALKALIKRQIQGSNNGLESMSERILFDLMLGLVMMKRQISGLRADYGEFLAIAQKATIMSPKFLVTVRKQFIFSQQLDTSATGRRRNLRRVIENFHVVRLLAYFKNRLLRGKRQVDSIVRFLESSALDVCMEEFGGLLEKAGYGSGSFHLCLNLRSTYCIHGLSRIEEKGAKDSRVKITMEDRRHCQ